MECQQSIECKKLQKGLLRVQWIDTKY